MVSQRAQQTTRDDPFTEFKAIQKEGWKHYAPLDVHTTRTAVHLVRAAGVVPGQRVLDVGCGTGPVAITARRAGAEVAGIDLTPELLARARQNAAIAGYDDVDLREGDAEALPYKDRSFDVVLSQFAHMFAPRPAVAIGEMLRVLKPGGTIAFSTWPPESTAGMMFRLIGERLPAPPGVDPPILWGDPNVVRTRLGDRVRDVVFERGTLEEISMSPQHSRLSLEHTCAPVMGLMAALQHDPATLEEVRHTLDGLFASVFRDNAARFDYLLTRATKV